MVGLFLVGAAICFGVSATRRAAKVQWTDIGLLLLTVALIFALATPVTLDPD